MNRSDIQGPWSFEGPFVWADGGRTMVCRVMNSGMPERHAAFGALIEAAPDVLAALERFMELGTMDDQAAIDAARAAIAKARRRPAPPVTPQRHTWLMSDGTTHELTDAFADALRARRCFVTTDPAPYNAMPVRRLDMDARGRDSVDRGEMAACLRGGDPS